VSQRRQCREDLSTVASKPKPFATNGSRRGEHWQGHSEKVVVEDLPKRMICSRFVPHSLTPEQKDRRNAACRDLVATADSDSNFFKEIVTGDETWCFAYDRTTKRQSAAWVGETLPRPKKIVISEVSCEDHVDGFLQLARRNPQRICSGG